MRGEIIVDAAAASHPGRIRSNNEDMAYTNGVFFNNIDKPRFIVNEVQRGSPLIYSVCDGMGGENAGEKASYEAVTLLDKFQKKLVDIQINNIMQLKEYLADYIRNTNDMIYRLWANSREGRMGSTFAGLTFYGESAVALNLGDSRVYMLRDSNLTKLTKDHTEAERLASMGLIRPEEVETHKGSHVLTRHFGTTPEEGIMEADFSEIIHIKKDDIFLLCSDGLTDMVSEQKIRQMLEQKIEVSVITKSLVEEALRNGGKDNVTVVVVRVKSLILSSAIKEETDKSKNMPPISERKLEKGMHETEQGTEKPGNKKKRILWILTGISAVILILLVHVLLINSNNTKVKENNAKISDNSATEVTTDIEVTENQAEAITSIADDTIDEEQEETDIDKTDATEANTVVTDTTTNTKTITDTPDTNTTEANTTDTDLLEEDMTENDTSIETITENTEDTEGIDKSTEAGQANSIETSNNALNIISIKALDNNKYIIIFSKEIKDILNITVDGNEYTSDNYIYLISSDYKTVEVTFKNPLLEGEKTFEISVEYIENVTVSSVSQEN